MATEKQSGSNNAALEARLAVLEDLFLRLAQAGATESILDHGFKRVSRRLRTVSERLDNIAVQVAPLRALGPREPVYTADQAARLRNLVDALVSPDPDVKPSSPAEGSAVGAQLRSAP